MTFVPITGSPRSGKNVWNMICFLGYGKVSDFCLFESRKFRKIKKSQGISNLPKNVFSGKRLNSQNCSTLWPNTLFNFYAVYFA